MAFADEPLVLAPVVGRRGGVENLFVQLAEGLVVALGQCGTAALLGEDDRIKPVAVVLGAQTARRFRPGPSAPRIELDRHP